MTTNWNVNEISQGINALKNKIDEALTRSASATLNSHRTLSASLEAAPQQYEAPKASYPLYSSQVGLNEADLYRSVQNYQVKSVHGFEPNYFGQPQYQAYAPQPVFIHPYQYPVQEARSATYGYEHPYIVSHPYQTIEYVDDCNMSLSQRNQSSGKKRSTRSRKADLQNDEDSFSKDKKPQTQQAPKNTAAPQNQASQNVQPANQQKNAAPNANPQSQAAQNQNAQPVNQQKNAAPNANPQNQAAQNQPPQQNAQQNQPSKQNAQQNQAPQQNNQQKANPQAGAQNGQAQPKNSLDKSDLVILPKKPYLLNTYNFGQEQRRGGSTK